MYCRSSDVRGGFFDAADVHYRRDPLMNTFTHALLRSFGPAPALSSADTERLASSRALKAETMCGRVGVDDYRDSWLRAHGVTAAGERDAPRHQILAHADRVVALPGAWSTLAALKARGLTIGIITDTMYPVARKTMWLAAIDVANLIDVMARSIVLGIRKPDPATCRHALDRASLQPYGAVFVGNDAGEIAGARRVGMPTVGVNADAEAWVDSHAAVADTPCAKGNRLPHRLEARERADRSGATR